MVYYNKYLIVINVSNILIFIIQIADNYLNNNNINNLIVEMGAIRLYLNLPPFCKY